MQSILCLVQCISLRKYILCENASFVWFYSWCNVLSKESYSLCKGILCTMCFMYHSLGFLLVWRWTPYPVAPLYLYLGTHFHCDKYFSCMLNLILFYHIMFVSKGWVTVFSPQLIIIPQDGSYYFLPINTHDQNPCKAFFHELNPLIFYSLLF